MAIHSSAGRGVADALRVALGVPVADRSRAGAQILYDLPVGGGFGFRIADQYISRDWDWVVLNGGGNDLWLGCGCSDCAGDLNTMIAENGQSGVIPGIVALAREDGAQVAYVGYMRSPGVGSTIDHCGEVADEFEQRLTAMAAVTPGVVFVDLSNLVPVGDSSYHLVDRVHPSRKGSAAIAARIAAAIR